MLPGSDDRVDLRPRRQESLFRVVVPQEIPSRAVQRDELNQRDESQKRGLAEKLHPRLPDWPSRADKERGEEHEEDEEAFGRQVQGERRADRAKQGHDEYVQQ